MKKLGIGVILVCLIVVGIVVLRDSSNNMVIVPSGKISLENSELVVHYDLEVGKYEVTFKEYIGATCCNIKSIA